MLAAEKLDIAILCPENARHVEVAEAAAARGVHVVTEKPMAASLEQALRMASAAEKAGVALAVNWPITWNPAFRRLKELLDDGAIGDVWELKWRNPASLGPLAHGSTHPGATVISGEVSDAEKGMEWWHQAQAGGGALLDYCSYGACVAAWLMPAPPLSAQGLTMNLFSGYGDAEDNAAILLRFPKAIAILEASWTTVHNGVPSGPILYGTKGTIVVDGSTSSSTARKARRPRAQSRRAISCRRDARRSLKNFCIIWRPASLCIRRSPIPSTWPQWRFSTPPWYRLRRALRRRSRASSRDDRVSPVLGSRVENKGGEPMPKIGIGIIGCGDIARAALFPCDRGFARL